MSPINNHPEKILKNIEEFLSIEPQNIHDGNRKGKEILEDLENIEGLIFKKEIKKKFDKITSRVKTQYSKLSKDINYLERTALESDWKKLAKKDLSSFIEEVMSLQEFLSRHKSTIRRNFNEVKYGFDLQDLANTLRKKDVVDEITVSKFFRLLHRMEENEIQSKTEEFKDNLERISELLLILKELKTGEKNIGRTEN